MISEYPAAAVGLMLFAYVCASARSWKKAAFFAIGAAPVLALALAYNSACFGRPWATGYAFHANEWFREQMARGFMGVSWPRPRVLWELLFGAYRGLLPISPFFIFAAPGFVMMWRDKSIRAEWALCAAVTAFYLLFVSGYYMWDGGCSMASRHLVPMLPFAAIPAAFALRRMPRVGAALIAWSAAVCLISVATFPEFPDAMKPDPRNPGRLVRTYPFPIFDIGFRFFAQGRIAEKAVLPDGRLEFASRFPAHKWDAYNLGQVLGLPRLWSLAPLGLAWAAACWALFGRPRRRRAGP